MALDNIAGIKSISVPNWLKLLIFGIVLTVLFADLMIVWFAVTNPTHKDWFSVGDATVGFTRADSFWSFFFWHSPREDRNPSTARPLYLLLNVIPATISNSLTWSPDFEAVGESATEETTPRKYED